jgi:hypothetical protein
LPKEPTVSLHGKRHAPRKPKQISGLQAAVVGFNFRALTFGVGFDVLTIIEHSPVVTPVRIIPASAFAMAAGITVTKV